VIDNPTDEFNERDPPSSCWSARRAPLVPPPRIILALDADEILAANASTRRAGVRCSPPGRGPSCCFERVDLYETPDQCMRHDRLTPLGYVDDGVELAPRDMPQRPRAHSGLRAPPVAPRHRGAPLFRRAAHRPRGELRWYSVLENGPRHLSLVFNRRLRYACTWISPERAAWSAAPVSGSAAGRTPGSTCAPSCRSSTHWYDSECSGPSRSTGAEILARRHLGIRLEACRLHAKRQNIAGIPDAPVDAPPPRAGPRDARAERAAPDPARVRHRLTGRPVPARLARPGPGAATAGWSSDQPLVASRPKTLPRRPAKPSFAYTAARRSPSRTAAPNRDAFRPVARTARAAAGCFPKTVISKSLPPSRPMLPHPVNRVGLEQQRPARRGSDAFSSHQPYASGVATATGGSARPERGRRPAAAGTPEQPLAPTPSECRRGALAKKATSAPSRAAKGAARDGGRHCRRARHRMSAAAASLDPPPRPTAGDPFRQLERDAELVPGRVQNDARGPAPRGSAPAAPSRGRAPVSATWLRARHHRSSASRSRAKCRLDLMIAGRRFAGENAQEQVELGMRATRDRVGSRSSRPPIDRPSVRDPGRAGGGGHAQAKRRPSSVIGRNVDDVDRRPRTRAPGSD